MTNSLRTYKLMSLDVGAYRKLQKHNEGLKVLYSLKKLSGQEAEGPDKAHMMMAINNDIAEFEAITAKIARKERKKLAKNLSLGLMAIGAIAIVGYTVLKSQQNK